MTFWGRPLRPDDRGSEQGVPCYPPDALALVLRARTAVYNESFRPAGFETEMVVWLPAQRSSQVTVAVHWRRGHFSERDRLVLDLLRPHFVQAHRNATLLTRILKWVARGKTNAEIGNILGISIRTVAKDLERMYPRLGVENRTTAAARTLELLRSQPV